MTQKQTEVCFLCKRTEEDVDFIDTAIIDLQAGWLWAPNGRTYCPICIRDRFDEIERIENDSKTSYE